MAEAAPKLPASENRQAPTPSSPQQWQPFERLRDEIDHLIDDFRRGSWPSAFRRSSFDLEPSWRQMMSTNTTPAMDVAENENAYEITAELPGIDERNVEVQLSNGMLVIKGEKKEEREEQKKDYFLSERRFGAFQRSFRLPDDVDIEKIEAQFKKGILTVTIPKSAEARKNEKKITVKAA